MCVGPGLDRHTYVCTTRVRQKFGQEISDIGCFFNLSHLLLQDLFVRWSAPATRRNFS